MRNRTTHLATLLMESHGLAPHVRSTSYASMEVWSKLYAVGPYFVDLQLAPDEQGLGLRGGIVTQTEAPLPSEGTATLHDRSGKIVATALLERDPESGEVEFMFQIENTDACHLEVLIDGATLSIAGLNGR